MKRLIALLVVCLLCMATASAAEWGEGLSAAKPYAGKAEVNLSESMGYFMLYPMKRLPAERFCDVLEIYLPREDVALGEGTLTVYDSEQNVFATVDFAGDQVELRPLEESELQGLMWGGGVCIEMHLPVSLAIGETYYVSMDQGCYTAADGAVISLPLDYKATFDTEDGGWRPLLTGDFGIGSLCYGTAPLMAEPSDEDAEPVRPVEIKAQPEVGDIVAFDVVLGGDAKVAVMYSENDSVRFDIPECTESGSVYGTIVGEDISWGVVFEDENNEIVDVIAFGGTLYGED